MGNRRLTDPISSQGKTAGVPALQRKMKSELYISSRNEWRSWLENNHASAEEIWLVYYKKSTGKPTMQDNTIVGSTAWLDHVHAAAARINA